MVTRKRQLTSRWPVLQWSCAQAKELSSRGWCFSSVAERAGRSAQLTALVLPWPHAQAEELSSRRCCFSGRTSWRCAAPPPAFAKRIAGTVQNNTCAGAQEPPVRYMIPCTGPYNTPWAVNRGKRHDGTVLGSEIRKSTRNTVSIHIMTSVFKNTLKFSNFQTTFRRVLPLNHFIISHQLRLTTCGLIR